MQVSDETKKALEGLRTELGANRTLSPKDDFNRGFNEGVAEALRFIDRYKRGEGLFQ